jgi:hypothetical protein
MHDLTTKYTQEEMGGGGEVIISFPLVACFGALFIVWFPSRIL